MSKNILFFRTFLQACDAIIYFLLNPVKKNIAIQPGLNVGTAVHINCTQQWCKSSANFKTSPGDHWPRL